MQHAKLYQRKFSSRFTGEQRGGELTLIFLTLILACKRGMFDHGIEHGVLFILFTRFYPLFTHIGEQMDIITFIIGFIIGAAVAGIAVYFLKSNSQTSSNVTQSETELKAVLATQAREHLDGSTKLINEIEQSAAHLRAQVASFEASLSQNDIQEDDSKATFFGEHASVYLRNSQKTERSELPVSDTNAQPRDFSSSSSGLFAGTHDVVEGAETKTEK